jgi:tRNA threonylcarbamoyladenosine biosynthesis protein TsaB
MILGLETATSVLGVAVASEGRIVASTVVARRHVHDDLLVPLCSEVVAHAGLNMTDLTAVAVSAGPGSYTGLRIGMGAAKGLCLALSIPLLSVPTCDAAAESLARLGASDNTQMAVCLDAKNDEVYFASYVIRNATALHRHPVTILNAAQAAGLLEQDTILAGDGATSVARHCGNSIKVLADPTVLFRGDAVALLGEKLWASQKFSDIATCEPLYLREFIAKPARNPLAT